MLSNYLMQATPQIEAVIFDLDDTLISWATPTMGWFEYMFSLMEPAAQYLTEQGVEIDTSQMGASFVSILQNAWRSPNRKNPKSALSLAGIVEAILIEANIDPSSIDIQALILTLKGQPMGGVEPYPDTHSVLTTLKQRGYKIGLVTNSFSPMWLRDFELDHYGLTDYFDARIASGDTGFEKPNPAIYWRIMGLLNTTPDKAVFVGDSPAHDICGANRTGLTSVQIDPPHLNRAVSSDEERADYTITALAELLELPLFDRSQSSLS